MQSEPGGDAMSNVTMWVWWYEMLRSLPPILAGLFVKD